MMPRTVKIQRLSLQCHFTYVGSLINVNNDNCAEIKKIILMANKGFYGLKRQFRSQFLSIKK